MFTGNLTLNFFEFILKVERGQGPLLVLLLPLWFRVLVRILSRHLQLGRVVEEVVHGGVGSVLELAEQFLLLLRERIRWPTRLKIARVLLSVVRVLLIAGQLVVVGHSLGKLGALGEPKVFLDLLELFVLLHRHIFLLSNYLVLLGSELVLLVQRGVFLLHLASLLLLRLLYLPGEDEPSLALLDHFVLLRFINFRLGKRVLVVSVEEVAEVEQVNLILRIHLVLLHRLGYPAIFIFLRMGLLRIVNLD